MQATQTDVIERTIYIAAEPETVFAFLTDAAKIVEWMGRKATIDARPGGIMRVDYDGFDIARGEFVEVVLNSRVVFTWGWESLADVTRPGASTVAITLSPEWEGTRLNLVHSGVSGMEGKGYAEGWDMFLGRLAASAAGGAVDSMVSTLSAGQELASRLNTLLCAAREAIEAVPDGKWTATTSEERPLNALARHLVDHIGLVAFAQATAAGKRAPQADVTLDMLKEANAVRDKENASATREAVLGSLTTDGPRAVEVVKAFTEAELDAAQPMGFASGQPVTVRMLIEGPLLGHIAEHLANIREAAS